MKLGDANLDFFQDLFVDKHPLNFPSCHCTALQKEVTRSFVQERPSRERESGRAVIIIQGLKCSVIWVVKECSKNYLRKVSRAKHEPWWWVTEIIPVMNSIWTVCCPFHCPTLVGIIEGTDNYLSLRRGGLQSPNVEGVPLQRTKTDSKNQT